MKMRNQGKDITAFLLMTLPIILIYLVMIIPLMHTARLSLFRWDGILAPEFNGLRNYARLFADWRFLHALKNISILIGVTIVFQVGLGILLAFFLSDLPIRGRSFYKNIIFLPVVISNVAVALYFISIFDYQNGLLNHLIATFGMEKINPLGAGEKTIWWAVIPQTWQYIGLMFIIAYTGFTTVSNDYIDASKMDGLNAFQRLVHMYLPLSWDTLSVCFIIALTGPLKAFEHIFILTSGGGGDQKTHIPATLMYYLGFNNYEYGYGSSIAMIIAILAIIMVVIFRKAFGRREDLE